MDDKENRLQQFKQLMTEYRQVISTYTSVVRVALDWREGRITAPLAMEQIVYIIVDDKRPTIDTPKETD